MRNKATHFSWKEIIAYGALLFTILVPALVLIGWATNGRTLTSVLPQFTPMNPVTAVCFILTGIALFIARTSTSRTVRRWPLILAGTITFLVGTTMLLFYGFGIDLKIDRILFTGKLGINRMAITTSFNFFILGICLIAQPRIPFLSRLLKILIATIGIYALIAYMYNFIGIYGQTLFNPMAIHTAFLFVVVAVYLLFTEEGWGWRMFTILRERNLLAPSAAGIVFLISFIAVTSISLLVTSDVTRAANLAFTGDTKQLTNSMQGDIKLYVNVSRGVQGLFNASDSVKESEWNAYLASLDIPKNYQGISAVIYAQRATDEDAKNLPYTIHPMSNRGYYFPITFVKTFATSTSTSSPLGFDYSSDPLRRAAYERAIQYDIPIATPVIKAANSEIPIFSVYLPVYRNGGISSTTPIQPADFGNIEGIISLAFRLERIFPDLIDNSPFYSDHFDVRIYDTPLVTASSTALYTRIHDGKEFSSMPDFMRSDRLDVAGRTWTVVYSSWKVLNASRIDRFAPLLLFGVGTGLAFLFGFLTYAFVRSREQVLSAKNAQLRSVIEQMPFGFLLEDIGRRVLYANQQLFTVFDKVHTTANTFIGAGMETFNTTIADQFTDFDAYRARVEALEHSTKPIFDEKLVLSNGRTVLRDFIPLFDGVTRIGSMWTFKDITEEENIDRMKTEFVSLASHQLRTPLTSIKWYSELLMDDASKLGEEQVEYTHEIKEAASRMNDLVGALLDVSRLDLGTFIIDPTPEDLIALMQSAVDEQIPTIEAKKQVFTFKHPDSLGPVPVDKKLAFIIVQNLISNAMKYSPEGATISLSLAVTSGETYTISCADNGYGIPRANQSSIFKKLFRADNIRTLDVEGTGLGLYMIKTIAEAADCTITFTSEEGKGSTFIFTIPSTGMKAKTGTKTLGE